MKGDDDGELCGVEVQGEESPGGMPLLGSPSAWLYLTQQHSSGHRPEGSGDLALRVNEVLSRTLPVEQRPDGHLEVRSTACGVILGLWKPEDADLLLAADLPRLLGGQGEPVHITKFGPSKQAVLLQDVPRAIPVQDIQAALEKQGVAVRSVERQRHLVRVELQEAVHHDALLRDGLDFFGAVRFPAVAERPGRREAGGSLPQVQAEQGAPGGDGAAMNDQDNVLQCYRCQGFWHVAGNCRHLPRCVRCGEPHTVDFCPRPRNNPVCCHCAGPHHAAFRQCPVRQQLVNATPISITMTSSQEAQGAGRSDDQC